MRTPAGVREIEAGAVVDGGGGSADCRAGERRCCEQCAAEEFGLRVYVRSLSGTRQLVCRLHRSHHRAAERRLNPSYGNAPAGEDGGAAVCIPSEDGASAFSDYGGEACRRPCRLPD